MDGRGRSGTSALRRPDTDAAGPDPRPVHPSAVARGASTTRPVRAARRPTGREDADRRATTRGAARDRAGRARPGGGSPPDPPIPPGRVARRLRIATALLSAAVLTLTGTAWTLYRDITSGIVTTEIGDGDGGAEDILLVGVDSRTDARGRPLPPEVIRELSAGDDTGVLNSDTIILLHVPEDGGAAVAFSIPRDSYVDIPGHRRDKINSAYPATKARAAEELVAGGMRDPARVEVESAEVGRRALIRAVEDLTGLTVDHYAELNLFGFHTLTTAIGGVEVCLKAGVDDELSGARLPAGRQTISGGDALAFVRQRHGLPEGDLSRIRRQQVFLAAVADKVLSAGVLTDPARIAGLVEVLQTSVVIDEGWDLLAFAQRGASIAAGNLRFLTIPTRGLDTNARGNVVIVDRDEVRAGVAQRIAEQDALAEAARDAPPPPPPTVDVIAGRYVVDVRNASEVVGLAGTVGGHARDLGFIRGTVDNIPPAATSAVRYTGPDGEAAEALAEQLGGLAVETDDEITPGHLLVVLGADFDPAAVPALAPPASAAPPADGITAAGVPCID